MVGSEVSPPLSTGVTFEIFKMSGTTPCSRERLKTEANGALLGQANLRHLAGIPKEVLLVLIFNYQINYFIGADTTKHEAIG